MGILLGETITTSGTWVCPKAGLWKVICVGGGASTRCLRDSFDMVDYGGATSFGTYCSALGGTVVEKEYNTNNGGGLIGVNAPHTGFNGLSYNDIYSEAGFGAGGIRYYSASIAAWKYTYEQPVGGSSEGTFSISQNAVKGAAGDIRAVNILLDEGEAIDCIIGEGGHGFTVLEFFNEYSIKYPSSIYITNYVEGSLNEDIELTLGGKAGCICVTWVGNV